MRTGHLSDDIRPTPSESGEPTEQPEQVRPPTAPTTASSEAVAAGEQTMHFPGQPGQAPPQSRGEVQKIHGVLRVVQPDIPAPPEHPLHVQQPSVQQPTARPAEIYCPSCHGGNPFHAVTCMWCGRPIDQPPLPNRSPSSSLFEAYKQVVLHASAEGFASEVPGASWRRVWTGLGIMALAGLVIQLVIRLLFLPDRLFNFTPPATIPGGSTGGTDAGPPPPVAVNGSDLVAGPLGAFFDFLRSPILIVGTVLLGLVGFFVGSLLLYWLCRRFGGIGRTAR